MSNARLAMVAGLVGLTVIAFGLTFGASYPFVISGDGNGYFSLIQNGGASTLYQPGYPFLFTWTRPLAALADLPLATVLRVSNYLVAGLVAALLFLSVTRLAGIVAAAVCTAAIFLNQALWVPLHSTRPEWLVGVIGLAMLSVFALYVIERRTARRLALGLALGLLFGAGYIVKVNFITFGVLIVLALLWQWMTPSPSLRYRSRLLYFAGVMAAGFLVVYLPFMGAFHLPKTHGESWFKVTYQQGWNLLVHLGRWQGVVAAEDGPSSARLILFGHLLPPRNNLAGGYGDITGEHRKAQSRGTPKQREMIDGIMAADHDELLRMIDAAGLNRVLQIPKVPNVLVFTTLHYLGLPAGEDLQVGGFLEAVAGNPVSYAENALRVMARFMLLDGYQAATVRLPRGEPRPPCDLPPTGADYTLFEIAACTDEDAPVMWLTGLARPSRDVLSIGFVLATGVLLVSLILPGNGPLKMVMTGAFLCCLAQGAFAGFVMGYVRTKETTAVYPVSLLFTLLSLVLLSALLHAAWQSLTRPAADRRAWPRPCPSHLRPPPAP